MSVLTCLHRDLLGEYSLGRLSEEQSDQIAEHISNCDNCQQALQDTIEPSDTLVAAIKSPVAPDPFLAEPERNETLALIRAIGREPSFVGQRALPSVELGDIGHYRLLTKLGEGGMGAVYKALHTKLDKVVALKVLPADRLQNPDAVSRFEREMRAVGKLSHPNIVAAHDAGEVDGKHYLVMEMVDGVDLSQLVRRVGPLSVADACELIRQAAVGLQHAHQRGMVHRDIKPSNLMLALSDQQSADSQSATVKILDMGLALLESGLIAAPRELTSPGQLMGTLDYMAPEQGSDSHQVDIRADIYSLGATLYKLLCGQSPFPSSKYNTPMKMLTALATVTAPSIAEKRDGLPPELVAIVDRMLAKRPDDRFAVPQQVAEALAPFAAGADLAALLQNAMVEPTETPADQSGLATRDHITSGSHETSPTGRPVHTIDATLPAIMESSSVDSQSEFSRRMDAHVRPSDQTEVTRTDEGVHPTTEASKESRPRIQVAPKTPSPRPGESAGAWWNNRRNQIVATAAAFGGLLLLAVVTLFFQTKDGTLVVEIDDPEGLIQVSVIGEDILITEKQKEGEPIKLRPGDHQLHVTRGELEFDSDNFTLKRGEKVVLNVKLAAGQLQVVRNEKEIGHRDMPVPTSADPDRRAAEYVLSIGDTITIKEGGQERSIGAGGDLPQGTFELLKVLMQNRPKVNDVGLGNFKGCKHLTQLVLRLPQVTDAELVYFKDCKNLTMLSLQDTQVTDAGLANFKDCKNLRQLSLSGTKVSDAGLAHLKDWNNLNSLSLYDAIKLSDAGVECLVGMKELSTLYLPPSITDGGMVHVAKLKGLRRLFLPLTITDEGLESVAQLDELELLSLPGCKVTDAGVKKLAALENLTNLNLAGTLVSDEGIAALKDLRNLKGMDLSYTNVTDRSLEQLSTQTMLTDLHLKGTRVSDAGLEYLTSLLKLSLLDVTSTKVTPAGFAKLQEVFPSCKITHSNFDRIVADAVFSLGGSVTVTSSDTSGRVSDAQHLPDTGVWETTGIHLDNTTADESQMLATMPAYGMLLAELREISLTGSKVGLEFQKYVAKHKSLERIDLSDTPCGVPINLQSLPRLAELRLVNTASVVGSQLAQLQSFPSLESLALGGPKVTDTALEYVQPITRLKRLSLVDAPVCGPGLVYVGRMTNLEQLDLSCPALTDEGLRHLKSLSNLTRISITGTKVTAMGVAELKLALPNCQIESGFTAEQIAVAMEKLKQEQK